VKTWFAVTVAVVAVLVFLPLLLRAHIYGIGQLPALTVEVAFLAPAASQRIRRFLLFWGFVAGSLVGFCLPTNDVEHFNRFAVCDSGLNTIHGAVLGVLVGGFIDLWIRPPPIAKLRTFSLATLLGIVMAVATVCADIRTYLLIQRY